MHKDELVTSLENQLAALKGDGEFTVRGLNVNSFKAIYNSETKSRELSAIEQKLEPSIIRVEKRGWEWGSCTSETCAHYSHDPREEGPTVFVMCKQIGEDARGNNAYILPDGFVFTHVYQDRGYHFCPSRYFDDFKE